MAWFVDTRTKGPRVLSSGIWQSVLFCSDVLIGSQNRSKLWSDSVTASVAVLFRRVVASFQLCACRRVVDFWANQGVL